MKRKFLEELGLEKEVIDQILDENSADIGTAKKDYADLESKLSATAEQLEAANSTIAGLKKANGDNEELQKTVKAHEEAIGKLKKEHAEELKKIKVDAAITKLLTENKAKYPELLSGKFDREKVKIGEDGSISGLDDQFASIKESYKDMFVQTVSGTTPPNPDVKFAGGNTFEALVKNAGNMTAEEVAAQFAAMENK